MRVRIEIILDSELRYDMEEYDMVGVLVLYYSRTGRTEALAACMQENLKACKKLGETLGKRALERAEVLQD